MGRVYDCRPNRHAGEHAARGLAVEVRAMGHQEAQNWARLKFAKRVEFDGDADEGAATVTCYLSLHPEEPRFVRDPDGRYAAATFTVRCYARVRPRGGNEATVIGTAGADVTAAYWTRETPTVDGEDTVLIAGAENRRPLQCQVAGEVKHPPTFGRMPLVTPPLTAAMTHVGLANEIDKAAWEMMKNAGPETAEDRRNRQPAGKPLVEVLDVSDTPVPIFTLTAEQLEEQRKSRHTPAPQEVPRNCSPVYDSASGKNPVDAFFDFLNATATSPSSLDAAIDRLAGGTPDKTPGSPVLDAAGNPVTFMGRPMVYAAPGALPPGDVVFRPGLAVVPPPPQTADDIKPDFKVDG